MPWRILPLSSINACCKASLKRNRSCSSSSLLGSEPMRSPSEEKYLTWKPRKHCCPRAVHQLLKSELANEQGEVNMNQPHVRVLVIGAGLGGLCLAQGLRKAGVDVAVYERDAGLATRTQGHRIHIDSRGEQALRECLPPSLYELFLATRGQSSRSIIVFSVVDGQLKEEVTQPFPESGNDEFITDEIFGLLPTSMHESFAMLSGPHPTMMLGCVWFRQPPKEAARQFWPSLSLQHTEDYLMWGLLGSREQFPIPDEDLQTMDSADLQRTAVELTHNWYPSLSPLTQQADPQESFFLTMRRSVPIEHWQSSTITLLGDAIHVMPANGSGANSALRDASQLACSLIAVASQGMPLQQALQDYEIEMLRVGFGAIRISLQGMQRRGPGIPFTPD